MNETAPSPPTDTNTGRPTGKPSFRGYSAAEIDAKRAKRLADVSQYAPRYLGVFRRAYGGKSLRAAVNAFCAECNGFDAASVHACTAPACPLYPHRPKQRGQPTSGHPSGGS